MIELPGAEAEDPSFPALHIRPRRGWLNDPNGICRIDGRYHVFFQYNPNAPVHGDVHWGHVSSADLLGWREEPVALRPRPGAVDAGGCWSGCVVDDDGVPTAVYTGVPHTAADAGVVLARSDRTLREWRQDDRLQAGPPDDPGLSEARDPFVFTAYGHRYAIQGAGSTTGAPAVLLYGCDDLSAWTELDQLLTAADPIAADVAAANIWECPNLFRLGDRWVLLLSLWRSVDGEYVLSGVRYLLGDLVPHERGLRFRPSSGGLLDDGPTFYAPQILVEEDRVLLWGWAWEGASRRPDEIEAAGWAGVLTYPRELYLDGVDLASRPAAELTRLRRESIDWQVGTLFRAAAFEVESDGPVRLILRTDGVDDPVVATQAPGRILVDRSMVEVFVDGAASTSRVYSTAESHWKLETTGDRTRVWRLALPWPSSGNWSGTASDTPSEVPPTSFREEVRRSGA